MKLDDYLEAAGQRRWRYGDVDCTLFAADWALAITGKDPAEGIRGTYSNADEANAIVDRHGGAVAFVGACLTGIGWRAVQNPEDGDIGIINALTGNDAVFRDIPAIHQGGLWLARGLRGIRAAIYQPKAVWRP